MADILSFKAAKKRQNKNRKASILCKEGHHIWQVMQEKRFETHSGKLMTVYRCKRCGKTKSQLL